MFEFCTPACGKQRQYTPHTDEMRWCPGLCQHWYHVECLGAPTTIGEVYGDTPRLNLNWKRWYGLTRLRIARAPRSNGKYSKAPIPFSLEKLIMKLREQGTAFSRTTDLGLPSFEEAAQRVVAEEDWPTTLSSSLFNEIVKAVDHVDNQKTYQCAGPGCWERI